MLRDQTHAQRLSDTAKADADRLYRWDAVRQHWRDVYEGRAPSSMGRT
jgi:hypothetical protein